MQKSALKGSRCLVVGEKRLTYRDLEEPILDGTLKFCDQRHGFLQNLHLPYIIPFLLPIQPTTESNKSMKPALHCSPLVSATLPPHPFPTQPPPKKVRARLRLIQWHHMPTRVQSHKREISGTLDLADLGALSQRAAVVGSEGEICEGHFIKGFLARPFEGFGPCVIAEPVTDKIGVALVHIG